MPGLTGLAQINYCLWICISKYFLEMLMRKEENGVGEIIATKAACRATESQKGLG